MTQTDTATFDRLASPYDRGMAPLEVLWLRRLRQKLAPLARGQVLEIGVGTGANMPFYPPSACLMAVDESPEMLTVAAQRANDLGRCAHLGQVDVEHLSFSSDSFDTVVASLVLCSVVDQQRALGELHRVLKPDGRLLLLEHMRPHGGPWAWFVDMANIPWTVIQDRCHLNRQTEKAVSDAGFTVEKVEAKVGGFLRMIVASVNSQ